MLETIFLEFLKALWILIPAGVANMTPMFAKGKRPIDFKKTINGKRILGDGKTWEGTILGYLAGVTMGFTMIQIQSYLTGFELPVFTTTIIMAIPIGTLIGDMVGSFIKRRLGIKRGGNARGLDQLDFIAGVLLFTFTLIDYTLMMVAMLLLITYFSHRIASLIAYKLKIRNNPW